MCWEMWHVLKPHHADMEETLAEGYGASSTCKFQFCDGIALLRVYIEHYSTHQFQERLLEVMSLREFTVSRSKCHMADKWVYSSLQLGDLFFFSGRSFIWKSSFLGEFLLRFLRFPVITKAHNLLLPLLRDCSMGEWKRNQI